MAFYDTADAIYGTGLYGSASYGRVSANVTLTGVSGTANTRTLHLNIFEVDITEPIYNAPSATGSVGSLTLNTTAGLSGVAGTTALGTLSPNINEALNSVSATTTLGSIQVNTTEIVSSVSATFTINDEDLSIRSINRVPVTGEGATGAVGTVEAQTLEALQSVSATGSIGTIKPNVDKVVDGVEGEFNTYIRQAFTANGDAQLSTAQKKFGTASLLLDGTGDFIKTDYRTDLTDSNFTVEFWFYAANRLQDAHLWDGQVSNSGIALAITSLDKIRIIKDNTILGTYNSGLSDNTWHHIALVRNEYFLTVYVDGFPRGQANTLGNYGDYSSNTYYIGCRHNETQFFNGYIDEFRTSLTARYTSTFTPTTTAFSSDSNTESLLHFDGTTGDTDIINSAPASIGAPFATAKNDSKIVPQGVSGTGQVGQVGGGPAEEIATGVEATVSVNPDGVKVNVTEIIPSSNFPFIEGNTLGATISVTFVPQTEAELQTSNAANQGESVHVKIIAEKFDFEAVKNQYSRRRTVVLPRAA